MHLELDYFPHELGDLVIELFVGCEDLRLVGVEDLRLLVLCTYWGWDCGRGEEEAVLCDVFWAEEESESVQISKSMVGRYEWDG